MKSMRLIVIASAVLLAGASVPALALDLSVGGISVSGGSGSDGGTSVSASTGGTSVGATLGGGSNIASAGVSTGGTGVNVGVGTTSGDLVTLDSSDGTTNANVNLGDLGAWVAPRMAWSTA